MRIRITKSKPKISLVGVVCLLLSGLAATHGMAEDYRINVLDQKGQPIPGVVVALEQVGDIALPQPQLGVMDQVSRQFVPHILVVQKGAPVDFPNSDSIKHHVYSFSPGNTFELKLFADGDTQNMRFDQAGEVELGCNVHDWMLGYIYVVDTPYFARTRENGVALVVAPAGEYIIRIWHPRIQDEPETLTRPASAIDFVYKVQLSKPLLPSYEQEQAGSFNDYE